MLERLVPEAAASPAPEESWNILAFASRSLEFLVPKPDEAGCRTSGYGAILEGPDAGEPPPAREASSADELCK